MSKASTREKSTLAQARAAKARAAKLLANIAPDAAVGLTRAGAGYGIKVNLQRPLGTAKTLPAQVDGVPVKCEVVGKVRKQDT
jgi:hypothetical protein